MNPCTDFPRLCRFRVRPQFAARGAAGSRGVVLILSLVFVILLTLILFAFQRTVFTEATIAQNRTMSIAASWAARGGIPIGIAQLELDDEPEFDSLNEPWAREVADRQMGDATVTIKVVDEARKFNILALVDEEEEIREWAKEVLAKLIAVARNEEHENLERNERPAEDIVQNILEWLENTDGSAGSLGFGDSDPQLGRDDEDEEDIDIPKSSPFPILTIGELMMVRGVTRELLYGPDRRELQRQRRDERDRGFGDSSLDEEEPERRPLLDFITCYGTDARRVNINTAPREVLLALDDEMTPGIVDAILTARERAADPEFEDDPPLEGDETEDTHSFRQENLASHEAFNEKLGAGAANVSEELFERLRRHLTVRSTYFTVASTARGHDPTARRDPADAAYPDEEPPPGRMAQTWRAVVIRTFDEDRAKARLLMVDKSIGQ